MSEAVTVPGDAELLEIAASAARHAVYWVPPAGSAWADAGARWLGRCIDGGAPAAQPVPEAEAATFAALTAQPRRYGWHATLRAPFRLADGCTPRELLGALRALADALAPFELPELAPRRLGDFLALCPTRPCASLQELAAACVTQLQPCAAPPGAADIARRGALTARQHELLLRWGYPYVLEEFRFHMSLSDGGCSEAELEHLEQIARPWFAALPQPLRVEALAWCVEPRPGAPFLRIASLPLAGA
jgi:hypothetical protein